MPKYDANNVRLFIESATPGSYSQVAGQGTTTLTRTPASIDTSTKDTGIYATSMFGQETLEISVDLVPDLPDASGFGRLRSQRIARASTRFQLRSAPFADANAFFTCRMNIGQMTETYALNDVFKASVTLTAAEAPTMDSVLS